MSPSLRYLSQSQFLLLLVLDLLQDLYVFGAAPPISRVSHCLAVMAVQILGFNFGRELALAWLVIFVAFYTGEFVEAVI